MNIPINAINIPTVVIIDKNLGVFSFSLSMRTIGKKINAKIIKII